MRAFILVCLFAVACHAEQGYNYQPNEALDAVAPTQHGESLLSQPIEPVQSSQPLAQPAPLTEEFQKEFYSYTAPEEQFDDGINNQQIADTLKKNLRIVFIRSPENRGLEQAALQLAKQSAQQQTAIYVLTKQADISNLAKQLNGLKSTSSNKPEVHFVKYRTPEDAQNAQLAIQNQYNQLPGVSRISNEGRAPVLNFASPPAAPVAAPSSVRAPAPEYLPSNAVPTQQQDYLPPSLRRFRVK